MRSPDPLSSSYRPICLIGRGESLLLMACLPLVTRDYAHEINRWPGALSPDSLSRSARLLNSFLAIRTSLAGSSMRSALLRRPSTRHVGRHA